MDKKSQTKLLKLSEIKIDPKLYPRMHSDFVTISKYVHAMRAGAIFPPVVVAKMEDGRNLLIDGKHRIEAAKGCKETHIQTIIETGMTEEDVFKEAVIANTTHGKPFTTQEIVQITVTMQNLDMSLNEISEIIRIPVDKIEAFVTKRITRITETGENIAVKKPLHGVFGGLAISQSEGVTSKQIKLNGRNQIATIDMLNSLFENGWIEDSETLRVKLQKLHKNVEHHLETWGWKFGKTNDGITERTKPKLKSKKD